MALSAPYAAAIGAVGAAALVEYLNQSPPEGAIPATMEKGTRPGLEAAAAASLPCAPRLEVTTTLTGAPIQTLDGSKAGADWLREFFIQRQSLTRALGDLGIAGLTNRPKLTAGCSRRWLENWLEAWEAAAARSPEAYAIYDQGGDAGSRLACPGSPRHWRGIALDRRWAADAGGFALPDAWLDSTGIIPTACRITELGRAFRRVLMLHALAVAGEAIEGVLELVGAAPPWIYARQVAEALQDFARELDEVAVNHGDARAEGWAEFVRTVSTPSNYLHAVADGGMAQLELAMKGVVGPALSLFLSTVVVAVLPYVVIGGAIYLVVKRRAA